ncbi:MAG: hypothetical protein K2H24_00810, partial [Clostridia bacterium]|nr:hypothetical protein [Clostridia bacterium]
MRKIGIVFREYLAGGNDAYDERSIHRDKLYLGNDLKNIFRYILTHSHIYNRLGSTYGNIYGDELKGINGISKSYQNSLGREYNV